MNLTIPSFVYDFYQLYSTGFRDYFSDSSNAVDSGYIVSGISHVVLCL